MAEKIISPGVFTNEIDASFLPSAIADIGAAVIGPTVKGPVLTPTIVTSYSDFQKRFGDSFKSGSSYYQYLTSHTAEQYLQNNNTLTIVRVVVKLNLFLQVRQELHYLQVHPHWYMLLLDQVVLQLPVN